MTKPVSQSAAKQTHHLTKPLLMEAEIRPRTFVSLLVLASCFIVGVSIWASLPLMRGIVGASGQVTVKARLPDINSPQAGRIEKILIREGQIVEKNAPLIHLKSSLGNRKFKRLRKTRSQLMAQKERLEAALQNRAAKFGSYATDYPKFARAQQALLNRNFHRNARARALLVKQIKRHDAKVDVFTRHVTDLTRQGELQTRQLKFRRDLLKRKKLSKDAFLEVRRIYEKTHGELRATRKNLKSELEKLNEARSVKLEFEGTIKKERIKQLAAINNKLEKVTLRIAAREQQAAKLFVRAPVRGVVHRLLPQKAGERIKAGAYVAEIIPLSQSVFAEIILPADHSRNIKTGQRMKIRIETFDAGHFGSVEGVVRDISQPTAQKDTAVQVSKITIALSQNYIRRSDKPHMIRPGMQVRVQFASSPQSFASYIFKPVYKSARLAFSGN